MDYEKERPFGTFNSELMHQEITIPEGFEATINGNKIILEKMESEDENIRKELIRGFNECIEDAAKNYYPNMIKYWHGIEIDSILAWLEKQGNIDKISYEIAEKEKYDFVSGQFIECRKSFDEFKEDNSYWFEYVGNDTYIGRSDNILNKKFHITPRQLYRLFTQQHCPKENNVNEKTNVPTAYNKYGDECLPSDEDMKELLRTEYEKGIADAFTQMQKEWSEEDDQYLLVCKNALAKYQTTDKWDADIISCWLENKLKAPQNTWKPSDEQMNAFKQVYDWYNTHFAPSLSLNSLYYDLKKLKGE